MNTRHDDKLIDDITRELDRSVDEMDFNRSARLYAVRHRALAKQPKARNLLLRHWPQAFATAAVVTLVLIQGPLQQPTTRFPSEEGAELRIAGDGSGTSSLVIPQTSDLVSSSDLSLILDTDSIEFFDSLELLESINDQELG